MNLRNKVDAYEYAKKHENKEHCHAILQELEAENYHLLLKLLQRDEYDMAKKFVELENSGQHADKTFLKLGNTYICVPKNIQLYDASEESQRYDLWHVLCDYFKEFGIMYEENEVDWDFINAMEQALLDELRKAGAKYDGSNMSKGKHELYRFIASLFHCSSAEVQSVFEKIDTDILCEAVEYRMDEMTLDSLMNCVITEAFAKAKYIFHEELGKCLEELDKNSAEYLALQAFDVKEVRNCVTYENGRIAYTDYCQGYTEEELRIYKELLPKGFRSIEGYIGKIHTKK